MTISSLDGPRDDGVVEPLEAVLGDVEPPQLALRGQQAVDVGQLVAVQSKVPEFLERGERLGTKLADPVPGQVEALEVGDTLEGGLANLGDAVAGQAEGEEVPEAGEGDVVHDADPVVPEVEAPEEGQLGDGLDGDLGEGVALHGKVLEL